MKYTQCLLRKGLMFDTCWIPSEFATQGRVLKIRMGELKLWSDGWIVERVYATSEKEVVEVRFIRMAAYG